MRIAALVLVSCLVLAFAWRATPDLPRLDDGFISLHSAQSLIDGRDAHYGSAPLAGVTSPPYVLLIVILLKLGLAPAIALRAATTLGLVAFIASLWVLGRTAKLGWWYQLLLPVAVVVWGPVVQQATNGVETGWAMAVAIGLIAAALSKRYLWCAVAAACLPWLRPDLTPMAGLLFLWTVSKAPWRTVVIAAAVAVFVFGVWAIWLRHDTGLWIPQSMAVKAAFVSEWCQSIATKLGTAGDALSTWLILLFPLSVLGAIWLFATPIGRVGAISIALSLCAYVAILPGALWFNAQRYLYPLLVPWLSFGLATLMKKSRSAWHVTLAAGLLVTVFLVPQRQVGWSALAKDRVDAAIWVRDHIDPNETIVVQDAGAMAVFTTNPLVDFVGLKTPSSEAIHQAVTSPSCGTERSRALGQILRKAHARYVVITDEWDHIFSLTAGFKAEGFRIEEVRPAPVVNGYEVFKIEDTRASGG